MPNGVETIRICRREAVFHFNSLARVDEFLKPNLILFGEVSVLAFLQQPGNLCIHRIQRGDVVRQPARDRRVPALIGGGLELHQLRSRGFRQGFEGIRPFGHDLIGFLLAVRPYGNQAIQPILCGLLVPDEVRLVHAKERQAVAPAIEGFRGSRLPLVSGFLHTLEGFPGLLGTGNVVRNGDGRRNCCGSHSQPHGRRTAQDGHEALDAATSLADSGGKLADTGRKGADTLRDFAKREQHRPGSSGNRGVLENLFALRSIQLEEAVQHIVCALDEVLDGGIEIIAQLLPKEDSLVLQVDELALRRGVALVGLGGQGGVLLPCTVGCFLCPAEQLGGIGRAQHRIAQTYLLDADFVQHSDGTFAFLIHFGKADNKCLKCCSGIAVKQRLELRTGHAADSSEILEGIPAGGRGDLHLDERL